MAESTPIWTARSSSAHLMIITTSTSPIRIRWPSRVTTASTEGLLHPTLESAAMYERAAPFAVACGLLDRPVILCAYLHAASITSSSTLPSQTASSHALIGASTSPTLWSAPLTPNLPQTDLPPMGPKAPAATAPSSLTREHAGPVTVAPYRAAGARPVRTTCGPPRLPNLLTLLLLPMTLFHRFPWTSLLPPPAPSQAGSPPPAISPCG